MRRCGALSLVCGCLITSSSTLLVAGKDHDGSRHKLDAVLAKAANRPSNDDIDVIITAKPGGAGVGAIDSHVAIAGGRIKTHHALIGAVSARVHATDLTAFALDPAVDGVSSTRSYRARRRRHP